MAISTTYINGSVQTLKAFLEQLVPTYFASVAYNSEDSPTGVMCKNADGATLLSIVVSNSSWNYTAYNSNGDSLRISGDSRYAPTYGYMTANGAYLLAVSPSNSISCIITKTNNNKTAVILQTEINRYNTFSGVAEDDAAPLNAADLANPVSRNQTVMLPFFTCCADGAASYTPNAFYMAAGELTSLIDAKALKKVQMNGVTYLTNGYWALKDE